MAAELVSADVREIHQMPMQRKTKTIITRAIQVPFALSFSRCPLGSLAEGSPKFAFFTGPMRGYRPVSGKGLWLSAGAEISCLVVAASFATRR